MKVIIDMDLPFRVYDTTPFRAVYEEHDYKKNYSTLPQVKREIQKLLVRLSEKNLIITNKIEFELERESK